MSDIRFNQWLHNSGTGGVSQVDGGHVGIGTTNPLIPVGAGNTSILNVGVVTANSYYGSGANLTGIDATKIITGNTQVQTIDTGSDGHVKVLTEGTEKFRIDSNGKITQTAATNTVATLDLYGGNTTVSAVGEVNGQIRFRSKDNSVTNSEENVGGAIKSIVEYSNGAYVGMSFETYKQDRTPRLKEALRITQSGNIGVNDTSPPNFTGYTSLSIHGSTGGALVFGDDGVDEWEIYGGDGTVKIYDRANTQERIRIVDNGAIGLGGANYGTSGQVLTSQGSGSPVQWATPTTPFIAEGGIESTFSSGGTTYMLHTFLTTGVFRTNGAKTIDFLLVGGGGGSAGAEGYHGASGGGGGGGIVEGSGFSLTAGTYVVTVGAGGAATNTTTVGGNGGDTTFANVTAKGGGGGADYASVGGTGGSGGGGGEPNNAGGATNQSSQNSGISNIQQFGFAGGQGGEYTTNPTGGGGGGGAGGVGARPTSTDHGNSVGGAAGAGRANSITGSSTLYGRGGIGGGSGYLNAEPGLNGRGDGATGATASGSEGAGAVGGTGIVIIRYTI